MYRGNRFFPSHCKALLLILIFIEKRIMLKVKTMLSKLNFKPNVLLWIECRLKKRIVDAMHKMG